MEPAPQTFGPYQVREQLGIGGMASVHLAETRGKDGATKQVALKRLLPQAAARKELRAAFRYEARLMQYLHHPNIPDTHEAGNYRETYFIAMEYVAGPTLQQLVAQCAMTIGTIPVPITLNIAAQVCAALDYAHTQCDEHGAPLGIIHRDVSPANIILSNTGTVKLIDFGLAKAKVPSTTEETAQGMIKGKYNYVAPEYVGGTLDARADLWALGVVMYELLTSRRLFDGVDAFDTITRVKTLPIPKPSRANPRVSPALDELVMSALARDPSQRWQTAAMMRDALGSVMAEPGNEVDSRHVIDWVNWVFTQSPGTESSGVSKLIAMVNPMPTLHAAPLPIPDPVRDLLREHRNLWLGLALGFAALLSAEVIWTLVR